MYKTILRDLMGGTNCPNFGNSDVKLLTTVMELHNNNTLFVLHTQWSISSNVLSLGIKKGTFADDFRVIKD